MPVWHGKMSQAMNEGRSQKTIPTGDIEYLGFVNSISGVPWK